MIPYSKIAVLIEMANLEQTQNDAFINQVIYWHILVYIIQVFK